MNPILALMKLWTLIRSIPWLWKLIQNWRTLKTVVEKSYSMLESARAAGGMPTKESFDAFMQSVEEVLRKGLIDIPDVDENILADDIRQMRMLMVSSIEDERNARGLNA